LSYGRGRWRGGGLAGVTDDGEFTANGDGVVLPGDDLGQHT
jgi:hypothetical protein